VLAKLNTDEDPADLAQALQTPQHPAGGAASADGRVADQFTGALPEGQVRQFLDRHLGAEPVSPVDDAAQGRPPRRPMPRHGEVALRRGAVGWSRRTTGVLMDLAERAHRPARCP
jgi:thioredoxin-like negative regulator of GroEL